MIEMTQAKKIGEMLAALGEPTRMRLIEQLTQGPQYVGELAQALGVPLVNVSHHLGVLRHAGLLEGSKEGRRVSYALNPEVYSSTKSNDVLGVLQIGPYRLTIAKPITEQKPSKGKR